MPTWGGSVAPSRLDFEIVRHFEVWRSLGDGKFAPQIACATYEEAARYCPPDHVIVEQYELRQRMLDGVRRVLARDTFLEAADALETELARLSDDIEPSDLVADED